MRDHRRLIFEHMDKVLIFIFLILYAIGCTPKLSTTGTSEDYTEDVSAYRPAVDDPAVEDEAASNVSPERGPYVPPTQDINTEMSALMDSIIAHNRDKFYYTYTIQVYIGRSREEANRIREKVYRILPEEEPELGWRQPSWLVTVGKYYDRVDAYKTLNKLRKTFPGAGMVRERNSTE